jgi:hypothetical protein
MLAKHKATHQHRLPTQGQPEFVQLTQIHFDEEVRLQERAQRALLDRRVGATAGRVLTGCLSA